LKSEWGSTDLFKEKYENIFSDYIYRNTINRGLIDVESQLTIVFGSNTCRMGNVNNYSFVITDFNLRQKQRLLEVGFTS
tara:strand:+ start:4564 stop:4800 length:237 start_codon:yes stop_codon:yes gene_type:complete